MLSGRSARVARLSKEHGRFFRVSPTTTNPAYMRSGVWGWAERVCESEAWKQTIRSEKSKTTAQKIYRPQTSWKKRDCFQYPAAPPPPCKPAQPCQLGKGHVMLFLPRGTVATPLLHTLHELTHVHRAQIPEPLVADLPVTVRRNA